MNKFVLILSSLFIISACSTTKVVDENELPPGTMEPANNEAKDAVLFPQIQQQTMPSNMK